MDEIVSNHRLRSQHPRIHHQVGRHELSHYGHPKPSVRSDILISLQREPRPFPVMVCCDRRGWHPGTHRVRPRRAGCSVIFSKMYRCLQGFIKVFKSFYKKSSKSQRVFKNLGFSVTLVGCHQLVPGVPRGHGPPPRIARERTRARCCIRKESSGSKQTPR